MEADAVKVATEHRELVAFLEDTIQKLQSSGSGSKMLTDAEQNAAAAADKAQLEQALATVTDLEATLAIATNEATNAKTTAADLQAQLENAQKESAEAQTHLVALQRQLDTTTTDASATQARFAALQLEVEAATHDATSARVSAAELDAQLAVTQKAADDARAAAEDELVLWKESASAAIAAQEAAETKLAQLVDTEQHTAQAMAEVQAEVADLMQQLSTAHATHADALSGATAEHEAALASHLQACRDQHETEKQQLQDALAEARRMRAEHELAAEDLHNKVSKMSVEMEMVQDEKEYVDAEVQKLTATVASLERALEDATDKLARVEALEQDVEQQCAEQQLLIDALSAEKASLAASIAQVSHAEERGLSALETKIASLEEALTAKAAAMAAQADECTEHRNTLAHLDAAVSEKDALIAARTEECTVLQNNLEQLEQALAAKHEAITAKTEELTALAAQCATLADDVTSKNVQLASQTAEADTLRAQLDQVQQVVEENTAHAAAQTEEQTALHDQLARMERTIADNTAALDAQTGKHAELQAQHDALVHAAAQQQVVLTALVTEADAAADAATERLRTEEALTHTLQTQLAAALADMDGLCIELEEAHEIAGCEQDFLASELRANQPVPASPITTNDDGGAAAMDNLTAELERTKADLAAVVRAAAVAKEASAEQLEASSACVAQLHAQTAELQAQVEILTLATADITRAPHDAAEAEEENEEEEDYRSTTGTTSPVAVGNIADDLAAMPTPKRRKFLSMMKSPFVKKDKERTKHKGAGKKRKLFKKGMMMDSPYVDEAVVTHARVEKLLTPAPRFVLSDEALEADAATAPGTTAAAATRGSVHGNPEVETQGNHALQQHLREAIGERDALRVQMAQQQSTIAALEERVQVALARPCTHETAMQTETTPTEPADAADVPDAAAPSLLEELADTDSVMCEAVDGITMVDDATTHVSVPPSAPPTPAVDGTATVTASDIARLTEELTTARATLATLQAEFDTLQDEHLEGLEVQEFLQGQVDEGAGVRAQLEAAQLQRMEDLEDKRQCHEQLATLTTANATLTGDLASVRQTHEALSQANASLTAQMATQTLEVQRLTTERDATQAELTILHGRLAGHDEAHASTAALREQLDALTARLARAEAATTAAEASLAAVEQERATMAAALTAMDEEHATQTAELSATLAQGAEQLTAMQQQRDDARAQLATTAAQLETLAAARTANDAHLQHTVETLQHEVTTLHEAVAGKGNELTQLQQALEEVCAENSTLQESVAHANQTIAKLRSTIADGVQALQTAQAERTRATDELAEVYIEIERLQEVQQGMADELVAAEEAAQRHGRDATTALQGKIDTLQHELRTAQQASTDVNEHIDALIELEGKYQVLQAQYAALDGQHVTVVAQQTAADRQCQILEAQQRDVTKQNKTLAAQVNKLQKKLTALREHCDNVDSLREQEVDELQSIITQQHVDKTRIETLQAEAAQSQQTAMALTKQIEQLKTAGAGKTTGKSLREVNLEAAIAQLQETNKQLLDERAMQQSSTGSTNVRARKRQLAQAKTGSHIVEQEVVESLQLENKAMKQQMEKIRAASVSFQDEDTTPNTSHRGSTTTSGAVDTRTTTAAGGGVRFHHGAAPSRGALSATGQAPAAAKEKQPPLSRTTPTITPTQPRPPTTTTTTAVSASMRTASATAVAVVAPGPKRSALKDVNRGNASPAGTSAAPKQKAPGPNAKRLRDTTDVDVAAKLNASSGGGRAAKRHSPLHQQLPSLRDTSLMDADDDAAPECQTQ